MSAIKNHKWLIIPIENKAREFDSKTLLAMVAAERGYEVLLGDSRQIKKWITCLPKGMFLDKSISINKESRIKEYKRLGFLISSNDEESFFIFKEPEKWLSIRMNEVTMGLASAIFAWGDGQAEYIRSAYPQFTEKVFVTGTPRSDMWRPELRDMYREQSDAIVSQYGRYILFPSNFSTVINVSGDDFILDQSKRYGHLNDDDDYKWLEAQIRHKKDNLDKFVMALHRIRREFPDHTIIIRPHPTDDHGFWQNIKESVDNLHVVFEGVVTPWLLGADAIFHHGCSTGIEARLLGRYAIAYHPCWDDRFEGHPSTKVGPIARDEDELIAKIKSHLYGNDDCCLDFDKVKYYVDASKGKFASERMIDVFDHLEWGSSEVLDLGWTNPDALKVRFTGIINSIARNLVNIVRRHSPEYKRKTKRRNQKWGGVSQVEVESLMARISNMIGRFQSISVREVVTGVYKLEVKDVY